MINSYGSTINSTWSVFQGLKYIFVAAGLLWVLSEVAPVIKGSNHDLTIYGEYSLLQFPGQNLTLTDWQGKTMEVKSIWKFNIKGEGGDGLRNAVFELPFRGFYKTIVNGKESNLTLFERKITLGDVGPYQQMDIMVWSESELNPEFESYTRIMHEDGAIGVDYPVQVTGFMAWINREKALIAVGFIILALIFIA